MRITGHQREQLQIAIRLLQLDGDFEVWRRVAEDFREMGINVPFGLSDLVRELCSSFEALEFNERRLAEFTRHRDGEREKIPVQRAALLVQLTWFLESEKGES